MGFIGKLIGGIFAFLGGIFKTIGGVFGIGKSDYYMEAAPSSQAESTVVKVEPPKPEKTEAVKPAPVAAVKEATAPASTEVTSNGSAPAAKPKAEKPKAAKTEEAPAKPRETAPAPQPVGNFATNYLLSGNQNGRRRPGPSLDYFRDMAKQVKN